MTSVGEAFALDLLQQESEEEMTKVLVNFLSDLSRARPDFELIEEITETSYRLLMTRLKENLHDS